MTELTLQEIQQESLRILRQVHAFCLKNGIRYSLAYGTMIGAARHKGFIPWDNDIDIYMPRPDYERFCDNFHAPGLGIISEKDKTCFINFCRVYDTERTLAKVRYPSTDHCEGGIWIDIFPMDGAPDDYSQFLAKMKHLRRYYIQHSYIRKAIGGDINYHDKESLILSFYRNLTPTKWCLRKVNQILRKGAREYEFGTTGHWTDYSCIHIGDNNFHLLEEWDHIGSTEFEGEQFCMLEDYDAILRRRYGDYMQLPPEKDRNPKGHDHFYWKDDNH